MSDQEHEAAQRLAEASRVASTELHKQFGPLFRPDLNPRVASQQRGMIGERLLYVQDVLADRAFLMGESFTVADAYLFVMLQWTGRFGMSLELWPNLDDYEMRIAQRPSVRAAFAAEGLAERHNLRRTA